MPDDPANVADDPNTKFSSDIWSRLSGAASEIRGGIGGLFEVFASLEPGTGSFSKSGTPEVTTSYTSVELGTSDYAHEPEPPCGKYRTVCEDVVVTLPDVTTVENVETTVLSIRYYLSNCGSNPPPQVVIPPGQNGFEQPWCKIYAATAAWEQLPQLRRQLVIRAQARNWSSAYLCYARLEVDWKYTVPMPYEGPEGPS